MDAVRAEVLGLLKPELAGRDLSLGSPFCPKASRGLYDEAPAYLLRADRCAVAAEGGAQMPVSQEKPQQPDSTRPKQFGGHPRLRKAAPPLGAPRKHPALEGSRAAFALRGAGLSRRRLTAHPDALAPEPISL